MCVSVRKDGRLLAFKSLTFHFFPVNVSIFGLAEKVEKNANLVLPDVSSRQESEGDLSPAAPPVPPETADKQKDEFEFKIIDDEGC